MKLFEHPDFEQAILQAAEYFRSRGLRPAIIEKDYYVSEALRTIAGQAGDRIIFNSKVAPACLRAGISSGDSQKMLTYFLIHSPSSHRSGRTGLIGNSGGSAIWSVRTLR